MSLAVMVLLSMTRAISAPHYYLTDRQMEFLADDLPSYRWAASLACVPPLALAGIHYQESDLEPMLINPHRHRYVRSVGGPFGMDMGADGDPVGFDANIRARETFVARWYGIWPAPRVRRDFDFAALCAADELREKARGPLFDRRGRVDIDVLGDALWGYHGRARSERDWRHSAYVNNDPLRGRRLNATDRAGALVIYREIERRLAIP